MPRLVNHSAGAEQRAHRIFQETSDIDELRAAQAYLLPLAGLTLDQVALMLGRDRLGLPHAQPVYSWAEAAHARW